MPRRLSVVELLEKLTERGKLKEPFTLHLFAEIPSVYRHFEG